MINTFFTGMGTGAGLIIAIGAQNAFVMSQGIKKEFIFMVPLICALSDALLISAGVAGLGALIEESPLLLTIAGYGGALFLFYYGLRSLFSVFKNKDALDAEEGDGRSRKEILLMTLALTWLNPHVYLDTVVLLGSIGSTFPGAGPVYFAAGAVVMSFLWFFGLSLGALRLAPLFRKAVTWRILDLLMCIVMWSIASKLIINTYFH